MTKKAQLSKTQSARKPKVPTKKVPAKTEEQLDGEMHPAELLVKRLGRPSKYDERYCVDIIKWFMVDKYEKVAMEKTVKYSAKTGMKTSETEKYKFIPNELPTLDGFARSIGVSHDTLLRWATDVVDPKADIPVKKYPEFCVAYNTAKQLQKEFLIGNGLMGNYPPASYIFTAKNITDMTDKQIIETKDTDLKEKRDAISDFLDTIRDNALAAADSNNTD